MDLEQIALFTVSWFAVGLLVALGVGKFLREAGRLGQTDIELLARGAHAPSIHRRKSTRKKATEARATNARPEDRPR